MCVLYLSTQGKEFEGGKFVLNDLEEKKDVLPGGDKDDKNKNRDKITCPSLAKHICCDGRVFAPFSPTRGDAVISSSGWENMHKVNKVTLGTCYAVSCFFTTCPVPNAA